MAVTPIDGTDSVGSSWSGRCNTTAHDGPTRHCGALDSSPCLGPGEVLCELGADCEAFEYLDDFETYRAAHANLVSADVLMDPEGELLGRGQAGSLRAAACGLILADRVAQHHRWERCAARSTIHRRREGRQRTERPNPMDVGLRGRPMENTWSISHFAVRRGTSSIGRRNSSKAPCCG